jgi:hypothetical protein
MVSTLLFPTQDYNGSAVHTIVLGCANETSGIAQRRDQTMLILAL